MGTEMLGIVGRCDASKEEYGWGQGREDDERKVEMRIT
jgi:hypothetical protein